MSSGWQAVVNGALVAMVVALAFLILGPPNAGRLFVALGLGLLAAIVTYVRASRT